MDRADAGQRKPPDDDNFLHESSLTGRTKKSAKIFGMPGVWNEEVTNFFDGEGVDTAAVEKIPRLTGPWMRDSLP